VVAGRDLILVVEDDRDIRDSIAEILEDEGYRVATAADGELGLRHLAEEELPSLILLDLLMPRVDAAGFREAQMREPLWAAIPTVIMSADLQTARKAHELSATAGVCKPVKLEELLAVVHTCLVGRTNARDP